jgi:hypothetical protein
MSADEMRAGRTPEAQHGEASLDELRARLYRPGATAEDRRRYDAAQAAAAASAAPASAPSAAPGREAPDASPARPRHRRRGPILAAVLVAGVLTAGVAAARMSAEATSTSAAPRATPTPGDDLLHWHPERPVTGVRLASDPTVQQFHGRGAGTAQLEARGLPDSEGRLEVMLTVADDAPVLWTATRVDVGPGSIVNVRVLGGHSGMQRRAVPVPVSFLFAGGPPTEVHVQVPNGVAWGLVVAPGR